MPKMSLLYAKGQKTRTGDRSMNVDNLIFEKVIIIKYSGSNSTGLMIVREDFYTKKIKKFEKIFKDCTIDSMSACTLTPEVIKELGV